MICDVKTLRREDVKKIVFLRFVIKTFTECFFTFDKLRHRVSVAVTEPVKMRWVSLSKNAVTEPVEVPHYLTANSKLQTAN